TADGLDTRLMLEHAREVGGSRLRRLTFHERAALLKALARYLTEHKEELYTLSYATGATKGDSWIDIDGGIGTLFVYASKGMRELPDSRVYVDGGVEALSKSGGFGARAPPAPDRARQRGAVHLRDRFAQLLDPRSRRRARVAGARAVRAGGRARDDGEGGTEVHRDPKSHHPRGPGRGCARRAPRRARQGHRRRSAPPERQDGTGGLAWT